MRSQYRVWRKEERVRDQGRFGGQNICAKACKLTGFQSKRNRVLVPHFMGNSVAAWDVK